MLSPVPAATLPAYHARLQSSHDARFYVDVLDLDENPVGTAYLIDGSITFQDRTNLVRRTANLTLADPDGSLDLKAGATWSGSGLWLNRLVRIRHVTTLPGYGPVSVTAFIGVPTGMSRQGPTVTVDLADKAQLASTGVPTRTVFKGNSAITAIRALLATSGETRFRLPTSGKRLSRNYSVGLATEGGPMQVAKNIARIEYNQELLYSVDGYLTMRPQPNVSVADAGPLLDVPQSTVDFGVVRNYWAVYGAKTTKKSGSTTTSTQPVSIVQMAKDNPLSPQSLARNGIPRYLADIVNEDGYTTTRQTQARVLSESKKSDGPVEELNVNVMPMYHLDCDDIVTVHDDAGGTRDLRLSTATIPLLGDEGGMSIGYRRAISVGLIKRPRSYYRRSRHR